MAPTNQFRRVHGQYSNFQFLVFRKSCSLQNYRIYSIFTLFFVRVWLATTHSHQGSQLVPNRTGSRAGTYTSHKTTSVTQKPMLDLFLEDFTLFSYKKQSKNRVIFRNGPDLEICSNDFDYIGLGVGPHMDLVGTSDRLSPKIVILKFWLAKNPYRVPYFTLFYRFFTDLLYFSKSVWVFS